MDEKESAMTTEMALEGVRVLDLTHHYSGPFCTKLLADYGADVIKVEKPGTGDPTRSIGPFLDDDPHPEKSGLFFHLNTNKRSITLNLKSEGGKRIFKDLVATADVVVESFRPHVMAGLGLGYDELKTIRPNLVMTSISSFGQTGPYAEFKATELIIYGMGGAMYNAGVPDREPVSYGIPTAVFQGGGAAAAGTMGALYGATFNDVGQHVDVSIMETLLGSVDRRIAALLSYEYSGEVGGRESMGGGFATGYFPCQDGYFVMAGSGNIMFPRLVKMMGDPEPLQDPAFLTPAGASDPDLRDLFEAVLIGWSMDHTKQEIIQLGEENGLICAAVNDMEGVFNDRHLNERGVFTDIDHPVMGSIRSLGRPFVMEQTPWKLRRPAPLIGQHNVEILKDLGHTSEAIVQFKQNGVI